MDTLARIAALALVAIAGLIAGCDAGTAPEPEPEPDTPLFSMQTIGEVQQLAVTPDGEYLLISSAGTPPPTLKPGAVGDRLPADLDGGLSIWRLDDGVLVDAIPEYGGTAMAVSPDGRYAAVLGCGEPVDGISCDDGAAFSLVEIPDGKCVRRFSGMRFGPVALAFTPDGANLIGSAWADRMKVWDVASGEMSRSTDGPRSGRLEVTPDGRFALAGSYESGAWVVRLADGAVVRRAAIPDTPRYASWSGDLALYPLAITPAGSTVVSAASQENALAIWRLDTGSVIRLLSGHTDLVTSVVATPNGEFVASGSMDNTIRVWSVATGDLVRIIRTPGGGILKLAISPDGQRIVAGDHYGTVHVWSMTPVVQ